MPHIDIQGPRLSRAKKAAVVAGVTKAYCEATGMDPEHLIIHLSEHPYDNIGVGGQLLTDAIPELRDRPWYYPLDDA